MRFPDLYAWFGCAPSAGQDEIKAAWKQLAKRFHPDLNPDDAQAEHNMKCINRAYEILSNPGERAKYDAARQRALAPPPVFRTDFYGIRWVTGATTSSFYTASIIHY